MLFRSIGRRGQNVRLASQLTNPFSGVSVELTMEEALRYDQIKQDEVNENYGRMQSGLTWFQKNNVDAYYKLLD